MRSILSQPCSKAHWKSPSLPPFLSISLYPSLPLPHPPLLSYLYSLQVMASPMDTVMLTQKANVRCNTATGISKKMIHEAL